jgi:hypothetical protein
LRESGKEAVLDDSGLLNRLISRLFAAARALPLNLGSGLNTIAALPALPQLTPALSV